MNYNNFGGVYYELNNNTFIVRNPYVNNNIDNYNHQFAEKQGRTDCTYGGNEKPNREKL